MDLDLDLEKKGKGEVVEDVIGGGKRKKESIVEGPDKDGQDGQDGEKVRSLGNGGDREEEDVNKENINGKENEVLIGNVEAEEG